MEEVDQVGEVDFGFDLAGWMVEDSDDEDPGSGKVSPINENKVIVSDTSSSSISAQVLQMQGSRVPITPTMLKVLSESNPSTRKETEMEATKQLLSSSSDIVTQPEGGAGDAKFSSCSPKTVPAKATKSKTQKETKCSPSFGKQKSSQTTTTTTSLKKNMQDAVRPSSKKAAKSEKDTHTSVKGSNATVLTTEPSTTKPLEPKTASNKSKLSPAEYPVKLKGAQKQLHSKELSGSTDPPKISQPKAPSQSAVPSKLTQSETQATSVVPTQPVQSKGQKKSASSTTVRHSEDDNGPKLKSHGKSLLSTKPLQSTPPTELTVTPNSSKCKTQVAQKSVASIVTSDDATRESTFTQANELVNSTQCNISTTVEQSPTVSTTDSKATPPTLQTKPTSVISSPVAQATASDKLTSPTPLIKQAATSKPLSAICAATAKDTTVATNYSSKKKLADLSKSQGVKRTNVIERQRREMSPCIAEVMALDAGKEALERNSQGLKMITQDISDTKLFDIVEDNSNKTNSSLNKKPISINETGPPDKEAKVDAVFVQADATEKSGSKTESGSQPVTKPHHDINLSQTKPNTKAVAKPTVKRIIRRFHRSSQTMPKEQSSKLLQCLIRIPALDGSQKPKKTVSVSANLTIEDKQTAFFVSPLPSSIRHEIFEAVSIFNTGRIEERQIRSVSATYGICIGNITQTEMDKSLFRENIVSKSSFYNFQFDGQDGIVDLYFKSEDTFLTVMTQIRKTKIGPRYLPVSFFKVLTDDEKDKNCPQAYARATVIFDQNFSSSAFLAYAKAQVWNKPKVEETFSIHNMPGGIPLDFLKQIIPDAITIEVDVDKDPPKFTQEGRRLLIGVNRKAGDHILKLFSQLYVNRHCLVLTRGRTNKADAPNLKEILEKQKKSYRGSAPLKVLKGCAKDINSELSQRAKGHALLDEEEILMQVDNIPDADHVLIGRAGAWKGPSTVEHLHQAGSLGSYAAHPDPKDIKMSESTQGLSDISDGSDIGERPEDHESVKSLSQRVSKSRSVRSSLEKHTVSAKGGKRRPREESKDGSRDFSERSHIPQSDLDAFGRNREMRERIVNVQQRDISPATRVINQREKTGPDLDDLRLFITGQRNRVERIGSERRESEGTLANRRDRLESQRSVIENLNRPEAVQSNSIDKGSSGRRLRYSPETERILNQRDAQRTAKAGVRRSKSPDLYLDSKDRFKRLVEEKLRGLQDLNVGARQQKFSGYGRSQDKNEKSSQNSKHLSKRNSTKDDSRESSRERERGRPRTSGTDQRRSHGKRNRSPDIQRERAKSPIRKMKLHERSASPPHKRRHIAMSRKAHQAKAPQRSQSSGRRITVLRHNSLSPAPKSKRKGRSSLSPISIGDDDDDNDLKGTKLPEKREMYPKWLSRMPDKKVEGKAVSPQQSSGTKRPISTSGDETANDTTSLQREVLQEFVKHLLERASISTSDAAEDSNYNADTNFDNFASHHPQGQQQQEPPQQQEYHNHSQVHYHSGLSNPQQQEEATRLQTAGHSAKETLIPPPIPPPIMPPILSSEYEKISHLESLANQLAADIQREQKGHLQEQQFQKPDLQPYNQHQELSGGMWARPPAPPNEPPAHMVRMQAPQLMLNTPPPTIAFTAPPMPVPQPVVPLPFFTRVTPHVRLQSMANNNGQMQNPSTNQYQDTSLNRHGQFF
ncbi:hypothetical protein PoB_006585700 [Plakobranchus ocellatus]|uniref:SPOC domain-containing protein n=1 Tax=Plakobranchus ocellatus TaxID=259542 RepID=A0AAV4D5D1_9GAST|nr:hypothetical protein PoB_006585700 [Plakobranchus ocellatus]